MKRLYHLFILLSIAIMAKATDYRTERIFIAPTGSEYRPGDSITVVGQILATDSMKTPFSKYLYVEIFDRKDSVLLRKKLRSNEQGQFMARLQASPIWESDAYYLRAYTRLMQNFNPLSFPVCPIQIGKQNQDSTEKAKGVNCLIYAEGGNVLADIPQVYTLAFFDANKNPLQLPFHIVCGGDTLLHGKTTSSGFQQVRMTLHKNKTYQVVTTHNDESFEYDFPACKEGSALQVSHAKGKALVRILRSGGMESAFRLFSYHDQLGMQEIACPSQDWALVNTDGVPAGCLSFFLTDDSCRVLSERTVYVDSGKSCPTNYQIEKIHSPESELDLSLFTQDSTTVFARILPEASNSALTAETVFKWTSSLVSPLPFPMKYYRGTESERRADLQAWLSTARFSQFDVQKALTEGIEYRYPYEDVLILKGNVKDENGLKMKKGQVNLFNTNNGKAYLCMLDDKGHFETAVDDFQDGDEFFVSAFKGKALKAGIYKYHFEDESYPAVAKTTFMADAMEKKAQYEVEYHLKDTMHYGINKNNVLPEIKVKARVKQDNYIPTKRFYSTNYVEIAGNEHRYPTFSSIIDTMPFVELQYTIDYKSKRRVYKMLSTTRGGGELVVLVDGSRADIDEVVHLSPADIESVEFLTAREALKHTFGAFNGALVVTTRKLTKGGTELPSKGILYRPMGVSNLELPFIPINKIKLPSTPGRYKLLVDCISSQEVFSYEYPIEVIDQQ